MNIIRNDFKAAAPVSYGLGHLGDRCRADLSIIRNEEICGDGYRRICSPDGIQIEASCEAGIMYALLDIADAAECGMPVGNAEVKPLLKNRGIKFNIPLDARVPSYTDAGDSAWKNIENMWSFTFWEEFLDRMALNKYNVLTLWTESLFPALVRVPEYPLACVEDVMVSNAPVKATTRGMKMYSPDMAERLYTVRKMTMEDKVSFWNDVMQMAADRCISVYFFTWNVFVYGTEGNPYGITDDMYNPVTRDFFYHGVKAIMDAYPMLKGIGITAGENMAHTGGSELNNDPNYRMEDIDFTLNTYGTAVRDYLAEHPGRDFRIIHRMQMARYRDIVNAFTPLGINTQISFKYSQAHMYSSARPQFIRSVLEEKDPDSRFWLTVRNDDFYMMRWGNPDFAREYLSNMPLDSLEGYYFGSDGLTWGYDYTSRDKSFTPLYIDKMWYMFRIWGQLSYNINLSDDYFISQIKARFSLSDEEAGKVFACWKEASCIVPEFTCIHWHNFDFQWYPEGCCMRNNDTDKILFADIREFMTCPSMTHTNYESVPECADRLSVGAGTGKISALDMLSSIRSHADKTAKYLEELSALKGRNLELDRTMNDLRCMSELGKYYSAKGRAALDLLVYQKTGDPSRKEEALALLKDASEYWMSYSARIYAAYKPQVLPRLGAKIDVTDFDDLTLADIRIAQEL